MPLDLERLLVETGALLKGHFRLSSGLHSAHYVQCARLLEEPRNAVAVGRELAAKVESLRPNRIVAPALGGLIIGFSVAQALDIPLLFTERKEGAMTLRRGFEVGEGDRLVIVEDVVTTGKSTLETESVVRRDGAKVAGFASILNRSGVANPFDLPYMALLDMSFQTHQEESCPLCARDIPLDAPGSRFTRA